MSAALFPWFSFDKSSQLRLNSCITTRLVAPILVPLHLQLRCVFSCVFCPSAHRFQFLPSLASPLYLALHRLSPFHVPALFSLHRLPTLPSCCPPASRVIPSFCCLYCRVFASCRDMEILLDGQPIFVGEIRRAPGVLTAPEEALRGGTREQQLSNDCFLLLLLLSQSH